MAAGWKPAIPPFRGARCPRCSLAVVCSINPPKTHLEIDESVGKVTSGRGVVSVEAQEAKAGVQLAPQQRDAVLLRPSSGACRCRSVDRACAALVPPPGCDVSAVTVRSAADAELRTDPLCALRDRTRVSVTTHGYFIPNALFFYACLVASGSAEDTSQGRGRLWEPRRDDWLLFIVLWLKGVVFLLVCVITYEATPNLDMPYNNCHIVY